MNDATILPIEHPRRFHFDWVLPALFRPRAAFAQIAAQPRPVWLTPLLLLTLTGLLIIGVSGPIRVAEQQNAPVELPEGFEWWTPEQQTAYMQSQESLKGPVFIYVFPALGAVLGVWVGWLVVGGLLQLMLTLFGGRDLSGGGLNLVAWAMLPFAVRDLVRLGAMLVTDQLIRNPGLSGFAPDGEGWLHAGLVEVLSRVDVYTLWFVVLLLIAVRAGNAISGRNAFAAVFITLLLALLLAIIPGIIGQQVSGLTIIRPFLF